MVNPSETAVWATALATLIVVAITCYQVRLSRLALGVDLLLKLEGQFNSSMMRDTRMKAAKALKDGEESAELDEILGFFETLGLLVHRGAVNEELVWNSFSSWVLPYAALAQDYIKSKRKADSDGTYWMELDHLTKQLKHTEKKKRKLKTLPTISNKSLEEFLEIEANLIQPGHHND
ncbi:MAG: hypothetical protein IPQ13_14620 [Holophagaceae bacterium]|nr:hypothetical protein [Holophagaceae bacterium]